MSVFLSGLFVLPRRPDHPPRLFIKTLLVLLGLLLLLLPVARSKLKGKTGISGGTRPEVLLAPTDSEIRPRLSRGAHRLS